MRPGPGAARSGTGAAVRHPARPARPARCRLTFDDGPDPKTTPAALKALESAPALAKATFFLVGEQVERNPGLAAEIVAAGHEVGLHGYLHCPLLLRTPWALEADLSRAEQVIEEASGCRPTFYRAPYGVFSSASLVLARRHELTPLLWSRWGREWRGGETPSSVSERATAAIEAGDAVLLHDGGHYGPAGFAEIAVAALPSILERLSELGLPAVSLTASSRGL